jgi:hypothetical protein
VMRKDVLLDGKTNGILICSEVHIWSWHGQHKLCFLCVLSNNFDR